MVQMQLTPRTLLVLGVLFAAHPGSTAAAATTSPAPISLACPAKNGLEDVAYVSTLAASGGVPPYTFSITSGALPSGLTLNPATGAIDGTPPGAGSANFTVRVVDSLVVGAGGSPDSTTALCAIVVAAAAPAITSLNPASTVAGGAAFTLTVNGSGFTNQSVVQWDGVALKTTFISANRLTAPIAAKQIVVPSNATVTVSNGQVASNGVVFQVTDPSAGVKDIATFVACVNQQLKGLAAGKADVADTERCVPAGCAVTLTMDEASGQPAGILAGFKLPHVLFTCPTPDAKLKFRPHYTLYPHQSPRFTAKTDPLASNIVEFGQDVTQISFGANGAPIGEMRMGEFSIDPAAAFAQIPAGNVFDTLPADTKKCGQCHDPVNRGANATFGGINPFALNDPQKGNLLQYVIFTDELDPNQKLIQLNPAQAFGRESLPEVCFDLWRNSGTNPDGPIRKAAKTPDGGFNRTPTDRDVDAVRGLCTRLRYYQRFRGVCHAPKDGLALPPFQLGCIGLEANGNFGGNNIQISLDGEATAPNANALASLTIDGSLSANGQANKVATPMAISTFTVTGIVANGAGTAVQAFFIEAAGKAFINGSPAPFKLTASQVVGKTPTIQVTDGQGNLLAGGQGDNQATLVLTIQAPTP